MSVTLNEEQVEKLINYLDEAGETFNKIRRVLVGGVFNKSRNSGGSPQSTKKNDAQVLDIDVSGIEFKQKGGAIAGPSSKWGWTFGYTQEGGYHPESKALVQALEQYGQVQVGNRIYNLGGRDNKLLNFKEAGK